MLGALGAIAIEGRAVRREDPAARAAWIAGETLAACGRWVRADGAAPGPLICVANADAPRVLAVLAVAPAVPILDGLPWSVRTVLRVLGVPVLEVPEPGVRVLVASPQEDSAIARVIEEPTGYRVVFARRA
jgi:hypothetical protein